eukprot:TRINITY_DN6801_c0_g1_i1.p1 TRINITY_DN6801_c0_g1~~TRINITY_DN6801_c0_g1_i1.p1  ORF type:complete len:325 (-),score=72.55 TRINITY_DN6801_c0_g1_i1:75-1049(-)
MSNNNKELTQEQIDRAKSRWILLRNALLKGKITPKHSNRHSGFDLFRKENYSLEELPEDIKNGFNMDIDINDEDKIDIKEYEYILYSKIDEDLLNEEEKNKKILVRNRMIEKSSITLKECTSFDNTGNICIWPSEEVLAYYCLKNIETFDEKKVLEIGAGLGGLGGLIISVYGNATSVYITDGNERCGINLDCNVQLNNNNYDETECNSKVLLWNDVFDSFEENSFDVIIVADCLFLQQYHEDLINLMNYLLSPNGKCIILAPLRDNSLRNFLVKLGNHEEHLSYEKIEKYDDVIWESHLKLKENDKNYNEDIHYPYLLIINKL